MVSKMANAVRSAGALAGRTASASFPRDQPDLDARHVYVSVHADGPTRVLCFSESKDRYTKGAGDESLAQLSKKLERLDVRIKVWHLAECAFMKLRLGRLRGFGTYLSQVEPCLEVVALPSTSN